MRTIPMDFKIMQGARCAVIGYGSWATALVKVLTERACEVGWYVRNPEVLESLLAEGRNPATSRTWSSTGRASAPPTT